MDCTFFKFETDNKGSTECVFQALNHTLGLDQKVTSSPGNGSILDEREKVSLQ